MTREEFERWATALRPRLVDFAEQLGRSNDDAEDIVQTALLELATKYQLFAGGNDSAVRAWFRCAVKHVSKRWGKAAKRDQERFVFGEGLKRTRRDDQEDPDETWDPIDPKSPKDRTERYAIKHDVHEALQDLAPDIRDAIRQHHVLGYSLHEIARQMMVNEKTLGGMLQAHIATLRERLKDFAP